MDVQEDKVVAGVKRLKSAVSGWIRGTRKVGEERAANQQPRNLFSKRPSKGGAQWNSC
jgi:hypothetical protein